MSRFLRHTLVLASVLLPLSLASARAQDGYYTTGTYTIDAAHSVVRNAYVGEDSSGPYTDSMGHPYNPAVNLVTGGSVGNILNTFNSSTTNLSGGSIGFSLISYNSSTINLSGGSIGYELSAGDSSKVNVSGGLIGHDLTAGGSSTVTVSGGSVASDLAAGFSSTVTVSGGTFGKFNGVNFYDSTTGKFTLVGSNLTATAAGADPNSGGTDYNLSGTLQNGTNLTGYVLNVQNGSNFTLQSTPVPELSSSLGFGVLLTLGGLAVFRNRRTARRVA